MLDREIRFLIYLVDRLTSIAVFPAPLVIPKDLRDKIVGYFGKDFCKAHPKLSEALSIVLAVIIAALIIAALFMLIIPQLWDSVETLAQTMPAKIEAAGQRIESVLAARPELQEAWDKYGVTLQDKLEKWVNTDMIDLAQKILGNAAVYVQQTAVVL